MIKIYQINMERDINQVKFRSFKNVKEFDFSIYDEVWSGENPDGCDDLEGIFEVFNLDHPEDFNGHSLSVSDIVHIIDSKNPNKLPNGYWYCDSFGWKKVEVL